MSESTTATRVPASPAGHPYLALVIRQAFLLGGALLLFAAGLLAGRSTLLAWPAQDTETAALKKINSELNLTPAQVAQVAPIVRAACEDLRLVAEDDKAQRLAILDETGAMLAPGLSPEQRERLEALQGEWQHHPSVRRNQRIVALF
jgi:hypothetical protein